MTTSEMENKNTTNTIINNITHFVDRHNLIPHNTSLVVGLSGGPDSVFLLDFLVSLRAARGLTVHAAHLNHEWRTDAHKDVALCQHLAHHYNVPLTVATMSELTSEHSYGGSQEAFGRTMRRSFLTRVQKNVGADYIALAHHAQDQQETFFIRLLRGATLTGLTAMRPKAGSYIRPLLETNKEAMVAYLTEKNIPFIIDPSNESPQFLRNRIRATVIPALKQCDTRFDTTFATTLQRLQETEDFLALQTAELFAHITKKDTEDLHLNVRAFQKLHPVMQERILMHWLCVAGAPFTPTYAFLQEIIRFLSHDRGGTHQLHTSWALTKKQGYARIHDAN